MLSPLPNAIYMLNMIRMEVFVCSVLVYMVSL